MHRRTPVVAAALVGLASVTASAHAQTAASIYMTASATYVGIGEPVTIGVYAESDGSTPGVFSFDIAIDLADCMQLISGPVAGEGILGFSGAVTPTGVEALGGSTDILGPTFDAPLDGRLLFSFQTTFINFDIGGAAVTSRDGSGPNPALLTVLEGGIVLQPVEFDQINFGSIGIFPAPSSFAVLTLAAVPATRRRR